MVIVEEKTGAGQSPNISWDLVNLVVPDCFIINDQGRLRSKDVLAEDCTEQFQCEQTPGDGNPT